MVFFARKGGLPVFLMAGGILVWNAWKGFLIDGSPPWLYGVGWLGYHIQWGKNNKNTSVLQGTEVRWIYLGRVAEII